MSSFPARRWSFAGSYYPVHSQTSEHSQTAEVEIVNFVHFAL
jgi:hypothetical protein